MLNVVQVAECIVPITRELIYGIYLMETSIGTIGVIKNDEMLLGRRLNSE